MFDSELHHRFTVERLKGLREQANLERHLPKKSLRSRLAQFLYGLACRLEHNALKTTALSGL